MVEMQKSAFLNRSNINSYKTFLKGDENMVRFGDYTFDDSAKSKLETYEWDRIWQDHVTDTDTRRVLIIGDSISAGYMQKIPEVSGGKLLQTSLATSKALDNPCLKPMIDMVGCQLIGNCNAVTFNSGLHGWHLSVEAYEALLDDIAAFLCERFKDKKIFFVNTTPTRNGDDMSFTDKLDRIRALNEAMSRVAEKYSLEVIDLFSVAYAHPEYYAQDGVHMKDEGYLEFARLICEKVM